MSLDTLATLVTLTGQLRDTLLADVRAGNADSAWPIHQERFAQLTGNTSRTAFADAVAQAVAGGCFGLHCCQTRLQGTGAVSWLIEHADSLVRDVLLLCNTEAARAALTSPLHNAADQVRQFLDHDRIETLTQELRLPTADPSIYFYEHFLRAYDPDSRRGKGVFYTPRDLVDFVVQSVDVLLRDEFQLAAGIAADDRWSGLPKPMRHDASQLCAQANDDAEGVPTGDPFFVRILDPAMGAGAFLLAAASLIHQRFHEHVVRGGRCELFAHELWDEYVTDHLLPRLWGQEVMLPPLVLAHIAMAAWLAESGFGFTRSGRLHFQLANTMQQPVVGAGPGESEQPPFTVLLGNPPFSGVSDNHQSWMRNLLRGRDPVTGMAVANYFSSEGSPLGERKHWLGDDYVKFMRFAHWQIERAGSGIVAFVTNHAYLDNTTFRGMREQLLKTFPRMTVVDLHGNARTGLRRAEMRRAEMRRTGVGSDVSELDQSVFGIEQGVAVSFLRRPPTTADQCRVTHASLWGSADSKLATLRQNTVDMLPQTEIDAQPPFFFLVPKDNRLLEQYEAGFRLCDIMPLNSTAVVTARDRFVVGFDAAEIKCRMGEFADPQVPDDEIRRRYFDRSRSPKYAPGDTRGWRLTAARKRIAADPHWERHVRSCLYRPFDWRQIFWTPWMIDWPRNQVMEHLVREGNLALVARRQMPAGQPCTHFWVTDTVAIDGVIRSDNRGSESIFPLFVLDSQPGLAGLLHDVAADDAPSAHAPPGKPNFTDAFIAHCAARLALTWSPAPGNRAEGGTDDDAVFTPDDLFHYIYALFHCPCYRQRFAEHLCVDFPRVVLPRRAGLFRVMAGLGQELVDSHLLRCGGSSPSKARLIAPERPGQLVSVDQGYPKYRDQTVWLSKEIGVATVSVAAWEFRVGTYQVCRKWLKDRSRRVLSLREIEHYCRTVDSVAKTIHIMTDLDDQIARHGGWNSAF